MTQPDHQADPSPRESPLYRQIIAAWDTKFTRPANDAVDVTMAMAAAECADGYYATTRTSPQLSEGMVERAAMAIQWEFGWSAVEELHDVDEMLRARRYARAALTAALADQGNE